MLYPFEGRDFSPLAYSDMVVILEELGIEYGDHDPILCYDLYKHRIKKQEAKRQEVNKNG